MMGQSFTMRVGASAVIVRDDAILLVEFGDGWKRHFNLPGGGIDAGESIIDGLRREVREETGAAINVGPLLLALEYFPPHHHSRSGDLHKLGLVFRCTLQAGSEPALPPSPDPHQVGVQWVPLARLASEPLLPAIASQLLTLIATPPLHNPFLDRV
jgi:8-oxo-dGTP pyrophosphatase MutT (NUDIX family)